MWTSSVSPKLNFNTRQVALCVVGDARGLCKEKVYRAMRENLISVEETDMHVDTFFALSTRQVAPCSEQAWEAAFASMNPSAILLMEKVGQHAKLHACWSMVHAQEVSMNSQYDWLIRSRPDLLWQHPIPLNAFEESRVHYLYDIVGVCPRASVSESWPCDVPNGPADSVGGGFPATFDQGKLFQVSFDRMDSHTNTMERYFEWMEYYSYSLHTFSLLPDVGPDRLLQCYMRFLSVSCQIYDRYTVDRLALMPQKNFNPLSHDRATTPYPTTPYPTTLLESLPFTIYSDLLQRKCQHLQIGSEFESRFRDLGVQFRLMSRGKAQYTGYELTTNQGDSLPFLQQQCESRRLCHKIAQQFASDDCSANASNDTILYKYTWMLCLGVYDVPLTARLYYYHPPAALPTFNVSDPTSGNC